MTALKSWSVILLAAGESRRMQGQNKLLLEVDNVPLLRRTAMRLTNYGRAEGVGFKEVIVVTGHEMTAAHSQLTGLNVRAVHNAGYSQGQMSSVTRGLSELKLPVDGVVIFLADLALIDLDDLRAIHTGFSQMKRDVLVPTFEGIRGNPIVIAYDKVSEILATGQNLGCKHLIDKQPEVVEQLEMSNDHCLVDIDTPEAYEAVYTRIKTKSISDMVDQC